MNRRAARRNTWLGRDLRARRRELLRSFWRPLTAIAAAFAAGSIPLVVFLRHQPWLQGAAVGVLVGGAAVGLVFLLALVDGTLLARIGRWHETNVGDDLRRTPGVYGVLSNVPFDRVDVDHVVLTPTGCYAVEVKSLLGHREPLGKTWGLAGKIGQADEGARRVRSFFRSKKLDIPVTPLLVLAGPGAPDLPETGVVHDSGVRVVAYRNSSMWLRRVAARPPIPDLDLDTAREAAQALREFTNARHRYDADPATSHHGRSWTPNTQLPPSSRGRAVAPRR